MNKPHRHYICTRNQTITYTTKHEPRCTPRMSRSKLEHAHKQSMITVLLTGFPDIHNTLHHISPSLCRTSLHARITEPSILLACLAWALSASVQNIQRSSGPSTLAAFVPIASSCACAALTSEKVRDGREPCDVCSRALCCVCGGEVRCVVDGWLPDGLLLTIGFWRVRVISASTSAHLLSVKGKHGRSE